MEDERALDIAVRAARHGGALARARLGHPGYVRWKGHRDVVCEASLAVQAAIASVLIGELPGSDVLAEEGPDEAPVPVDAEHLWVVDPTCGSLNFVQGVPHFAISIALRSRGGIRAAVVFDPCRDELFAATSDTAATLNGRPIFVQQLSDGVEAWASALVGTDWPYERERRAQARRILGTMLDQVTECSVMGSPALGICYVAAGRLHAYWHLDLKLWDVAAAGLIVQRAGGLLTDAQGMSWLYSDGSYVATNFVVQNSTVNCIQSMLNADRAVMPRDGE